MVFTSLVNFVSFKMFPRSLQDYNFYKKLSMKWNLYNDLFSFWKTLIVYFLFCKCCIFRTCCTCLLGNYARLYYLPFNSSLTLCYYFSHICLSYLFLLNPIQYCLLELWTNSKCKVAHKHIEKSLMRNLTMS